jgi:outer membrane biosynthesis protein TonB
MRAGLTVSIIGHVAILGFGLIAFPQGASLQAPDIEALPVDLVTQADVTDLLKGNKNSEIVPKENPQPKPTVQAESPAPPAEKPAPKPVEATPPPAPAPAPAPEPEPPRPEPPKPEPKPEPEPPKPAEVAALPEPEATIPPAPAVPVEPAKPRPRPTPPKPVEKKPEPKPEVAQPEKKPEFNPDDIAALLNKQTPTGGGDPEPATAPQTLGSINGHENASMTQSEIDALKAKLYRCWNPPVAVREATTLVVAVRITLLPDGSLSGEPQIVGIARASDPLAQVAAEAAIRAVVQCAPFGDILRPENYALWNQIDFFFDPAKLIGGG